MHSDLRQTNWAGGNRADLEGPADEDDEDGHDAEHDPAEMGIGDEDGLEEQAGLFDRSGDEGERVFAGGGYDALLARRRLRTEYGAAAVALKLRLNGRSEALGRNSNLLVTL